MSARFPLLRLPFVPSKNVLDMMQSRELILLAMCSKRIRNVLREANKNMSIDSLEPHQKYQLNILEIISLLSFNLAEISPSLESFPGNNIVMTITVSRDIKIEITDNGRMINFFMPLLIFVENLNQLNHFAETKIDYTIGNITVPVVNPVSRTMYTFWDDQSQGLKVLVDYFKRLFHPRTINCYVHGNRNREFSQNLRAVIEGMDTNTIDHFFVNYGGDIEFDDYQFILDNFKPKICFETTGYEVKNLQHKTNFNSLYLKLSPAKWFTLDNLLTTNCENINLLATSFSNDDMNEYLRQWMTGRFSNLKRLTVELLDDVNLEYILSGLTGCPFHEKHGYTIERPNRNDIFIRRQDTPTVKLSSSYVGSFRIKFELSIL